MSEINTTQISGRISEEDYNFLMEYPLSGKVTVSEKLRHACAYFRAHTQGMRNFPECLAELQVEMQAARKDIKETELALGAHSELVDRMISALPEAMAYLVTFRKPAEQRDRLKSLLHTEERLLSWSVSLLDSLLRMGLTKAAPAYNPKLLEGKLDRVLELLEIIASRK